MTPTKFLYPILDLATFARGGDPVERAAASAEALRGALRGTGIDFFAVQVRASGANLADRAFLKAARCVVKVFSGSGVPVYVNDRPDVARLAGADGVHLGTGDLPPQDVRAAFSGLAVGLSSHAPGEFRDRLAERPDYLAYGPIFSTATKADAAPAVGLDDLPALAGEARAAGVPVVAIGGIDAARARDVLAAGADAVAVISALFAQDADVAKAARAFADAAPARTAPKGRASGAAVRADPA